MECFEHLPGAGRHVMETISQRCPVLIELRHLRYRPELTHERAVQQFMFVPNARFLDGVINVRDDTNPLRRDQADLANNCELTLLFGKVFATRNKNLILYRASFSTR